MEKEKPALYETRAGFAMCSFQGGMIAGSVVTRQVAKEARAVRGDAGQFRRIIPGERGDRL
jgi:hypothetical protein